MAAIVCIAIEDGSRCSGSAFFLNAAGITAFLIGATAKAAGPQIAHITSTAFAGMIIIGSSFERDILA